jgi:hypothetical protein
MTFERIIIVWPDEFLPSTAEIERKLKEEPRLWDEAWRFATKDELEDYVRLTNPIDEYTDKKNDCKLVALGHVDRDPNSCWIYSWKHNRYYKVFRYRNWGRHHSFLIVR